MVCFSFVLYIESVNLVSILFICLLFCSLPVCKLLLFFLFSFLSFSFFHLISLTTQHVCVEINIYIYIVFIYNIHDVSDCVFHTHTHTSNYVDTLFWNGFISCLRYLSWPNQMNVLIQMNKIEAAIQNLHRFWHTTHAFGYNQVNMYSIISSLSTVSSPFHFISFGWYFFHFRLSFVRSFVHVQSFVRSILCQWEWCELNISLYKAYSMVVCVCLWNDLVLFTWLFMTSIFSQFPNRMRKRNFWI